MTDDAAVKVLSIQYSTFIILGPGPTNAVEQKTNHSLKLMKLLK